MARPRAFDSGTAALLCPNAHRGLLLDKYLDPNAADVPRLEMLKGLSGKLAGNAYRLAFQRWRREWDTGATDRLCRLGSVSGRLALGLGAANVYENGLRLHPSYGVPFIPASSWKGALQARVAGEQYCPYLFGTQTDRGAIKFQDAWAEPDSCSLVLDVLTPHHQKYYAGENAPPTDFDSPVPIHLLTITGKFLFIADTPDQRCRNFVEKLLLDVTQVDGLGAKRSSGYGRFEF